MIRFDGYYTYEPILYQERKEHDPNYLNKAYIFNENGVVRGISKWSTKNENLLFTKEDFDKDFGEYCYEINDKEMYFVDKAEKDGYKFYYDIITPTKIKYRDDGDIMKFVPWSKDSKEEEPKKAKKDRPIASPLDTLKNEAQPNSEWIWFLVCFLTIVLIRYILKTYF